MGVDLRQAAGSSSCARPLCSCCGGDGACGRRDQAGPASGSEIPRGIQGDHHSARPPRSRLLESQRVSQDHRHRQDRQAERNRSNSPRQTDSGQRLRAVDEGSYLHPIKDGETRITVSAGGLTAELPVTVRNLASRTRSHLYATWSHPEQGPAAPPAPATARPRERTDSSCRCAATTRSSITRAWFTSLRPAIQPRRSRAQPDAAQAHRAGSARRRHAVRHRFAVLQDHLRVALRRRPSATPSPPMSSTWR